MIHISNKLLRTGSSKDIARRLGGAIVLSFVLFSIAILPYLYILNLSYTGIDTIPTIAAGKIDTLSELPGVFLRELRGGITPFLSYYRPLTLLTYTYDYTIWGWNPFGYHLTDLLLYGLAVVSVFWMVLYAFRQPLIIALLVGLIFLIHPVANEVVPAISRRQEPIFMVGLAIALMGAAKMPHRRGLIVSLVGCVIAILSVERALITPAILFGFLYLIRLEKYPYVERIRLSLLWSLPYITIAVGFFILRWFLFGNTGIQFSPRNVVQFPISYFISVIYPQQIIPLRWSSNQFAIVLIILVSTLFSAITVYIFLKSPKHNLFLFCSVVILLIGLFLATAGQLLPWYPYVASAFFALLVVSLAFESVDKLRNSGWRDTQSIVILSSITLILLPMVIASPVFSSYEGWKIASEQVENITRDLQRLTKKLPDDTGLVLINVPSHYQENNSEYRITRSAAILWPYSLQPWLDDQGVENPILILGSSTHIGGIRTPVVQKINTDKIQVYFNESDSQYSDIEFSWPPPEMGNYRFVTYIFDGQQFIEDTLLSQD